ncbi:MAG: redox-regulated ATPase YchF [Nanoarchaeota archaeon]
MLIGLVGKPSAGKSTFFKACTLADVLIAAYPFATIKPNHGIGYVKIDCIEKDFKTKCNPQKGYCVNGKRFVPVELMDVAGLVTGASEGKGLGNEFLNDLSNADAFIHIVDVSGETNAEGKEVRGYDPLQDVVMLEKELDLWYAGILKKVWRVFSKTVQNEKSDLAKAIAKQFSGLKVDEHDVKQIFLKKKYPEKVLDWTQEDLLDFAHRLRHVSKPMIIAANKMDKKDSEKNLARLRAAYPDVKIIPMSADYELTLREATSRSFILYVPGEHDFTIVKPLNEKQTAALEHIRQFLKTYNGTGVQEILNFLVFDLLHYLPIFPASANRLSDSKGNILPDCFLLPRGSTALDFAFFIHSDLGNNFIRAIDARTKRVLGKEYVLKFGDALEIITR